VSCHFLLIGTGREIYPKIKAMGHRLSLICPMPNLKRLSNHDLYDRVVGMPASATPEEWAEQACLIHRHDPIDALGGFNELTQHLAAAVAGRLGLPYHTPDVICRTRHKAEMRRVLRAAGVDDTPAGLVAGAQEIGAFAAEHGFPIVLKPVDGRGSLGVSIVRSGEDIPAALEWFGQWAADHQMLAEKFLHGQEYSVEAFSERGRHRVVCITQKFTDSKTRVETGHCLPAPLTEAVWAEIACLVTRALAAIGLENGPSHTEVIVTPDGPRIVESHARLGGDQIVDLIQLTTGVDLDSLWIRQVAGESILDEVPTTFTSWAAIAYATPQAVGRLEQVLGREQAEASPGVVRVQLVQDPGSELCGLSDSFSRGAYAIAVGDSSEAATARARQAAGMLRFVVSCAG
jgi:biotin carboxylase